MKSLRILSLIVLLSMFEKLSVWSQGVIVYKKDGSKTIYPYEQVDSIVTFDYDDDLQNVTEGVRTFTPVGDRGHLPGGAGALQNQFRQSGRRRERR